MIPSPHRPSVLLKPAALAAALSAVLLLAAGCGKKDAAPAAPQPFPVSVLVVAPEPVTLSQELPGRTSAFRVAEVRARINGIVQKRLFTEGADVKDGDVLFEIDPAPYQAALDSAKATLARAEAGLASAQAQADRFKGLVSTNAISQQNYDDAVASSLGSAADVAAAKAAVRTAEINLGYTRVTSPIDGRIGRAEVTEGAYVQQGTATLLATVQQLDPLYVDLSQSADDVLRLKEALASGRLQRAGEGAAKLSLMLNNNQPYAHPGALQFSDVSVNPSTGTVTLRAIFPNPDNNLFPGMFVRARLEEGIDPSAILLPQPLVSRNTKGEATALLVNAENKVEVRVLQTSRTVGNRWLISGGLQPGDRVISDNLQKIRPGMVVKPVPAAAATPASANAVLQATRTAAR
jgi:membrane fusion protein (multidrug efflux system)